MNKSKDSRANRSYTVLLIAIIVIATFLRLWKLDEVPVSVFGDEIDVGIQASSILATGKDYLSNSFPILFHSFSEYRLPMQLYLGAPSVGFFGLNEWGVRMPNVIFGLITLVSFYYLIRELFGQKLAIISTAFLAISPVPSVDPLSTTMICTRYPICTNSSLGILLIV